MNAFVSQFGIDWKMLLSQITAFVVLFVLLRFLAYKPILAILKKRQENIEQGQAKAKEADIRLLEVDKISLEKLKQTDQKALNIIKQTEQRARKLETALMAKVKTKEADMLAKANQLSLAKKAEMESELKREAVAIVKSIIAKTVEMEPNKIDEALIKKAAKVRL